MSNSPLWRTPSHQNYTPYHAVIRWLVATRQARSRWFNPGAFGEPAWDILLVLYEAEIHHRSLAMSEVGKRASVPSTSLTRWIETLVGWGMVDRVDDPHDRRTSRISITPAARAKLESFCQEMLATAPLSEAYRDETTPP